MPNKYFLLRGRSVGSAFTVRNGESFQLGETVPIFDVSPDTRNSRARQVAVARCIEDCAQEHKYDFQPFSTPGRSGGPLSEINTGDGAYRFVIEEL